MKYRIVPFPSTSLRYQVEYKSFLFWHSGPYFISLKDAQNYIRTIESQYGE